ncbi:hypothetical protein JGI7_01618 [Candidatus Kryptonium thompsonii]|uniref:Lipoprotein n=2 Tax=Candidatus Kryptonium thompsonii TaxID=1633631 RepID=A0A0P1NZL5_9BACT|nr:hypothetical protein [Candidatus Kryptonium thompsoni]CUS83087.1 hypothetical protein JGI14_10149 [Candidatus Kryptonium thompsoni]CUS83406.1 hypothetical protein JGI16_10576 [Candidatus Kryptonium thompsoni]CUS84298.1 hypothetical protein JGI12_00761 [Candidatus Kryptonium thompsoni]CUS89599.1 hypothetical protein JGI15_105112 [Candidatus Kryptonium thompsoni]CUS91973.1 hypothetical protein JGI7_01618 [Candidatus Kryptonium thompsoni]
MMRITFLLCLAFISCQLFKTRSPETPTEVTEQLGWKQPITPEITLENLRNAIYYRNTENYIRCFVDSNFSDKRFTFVPTQEAQIQYPDIFRNWSLNSERNYFNNIKTNVPQGGTSDLVLSGSFQSFGTDEAVYYASYLVNFQHVVKDVPQSAKGNLQFYLVSDKNGNWVIYKWIDIKIQNEFSWSELKAKFSY